MDVFFKFIAIAALASVGVVLFFGLKNLATGGSPNVSQKLMRMRVLFQMIAVAILMLGLFLFGK
ncbi:MAG: twin transmembrane helix small protein [Pseudomonadota bacterium]